MRLQSTVGVYGVLIGCVVALAAPSEAARIHLGLPNGTDVAYRRAAGDAAWTAEPAGVLLPDVGYYAAPALAEARSAR